MSTFTKIILIILPVALIGFIVGTYFYFQFKTKPKAEKQEPARSFSAPSNLPQAAEVGARVNIDKKLALVAGLNIFDITKDQVQAWAKQDGILTVPAYSGPGPSPLPDEPTPNASPVIRRPSSAHILAGTFKGQDSKSFFVMQASKTATLTTSGGSRVWTKIGNNVQVSSKLLGDLISLNALVDFVREGDLVLAVGVTQDNGSFKTQGLVVFK